MDRHIHRSANAVPNDDPSIESLTVDQIMRDRGVGKRYAYQILRQMTEDLHADVQVPQGQRDRVLSVLYRSDGKMKNLTLLVEALHQDGFKIDAHDTAKTLWSLQKTGHVKFREHTKPRTLYAIRLTDEGWAAGRDLNTIKLEVPAEPTIFEEDEEVPVIITELPTEITVDIRGRPWPKGDLTDWPAFQAIRNRAIKAKKLNAAAKLLEDVGEDGLALTIMAKTEFTNLEEEVIRLLQHLGEIEDDQVEH